MKRGVRRAVSLGISALACGLGACATTSKAWTPATSLDTHDDPATVRPGYGNEELHTWWPLTAREVSAMRGVEAARAGDARALLALGLVASGDHRDEASQADFTARVERFVVETRPVIDAAPDEWHKGYELHRAMHRSFFGGERTDLGSYELDQAHLTGVFTTGHYNCLSSTLLYLVLARAFELPVRGVVVPTHVFVELGDATKPGAKIIEIETTSDTGFDLVHDARFYREDAGGWSSKRGLRPVTFEEYEHRRIVEPYQLVALAMRDGRAGTTEEDRARLDELSSLVDPADADAQRERLRDAHREASAFYDSKSWRTMARMFDVLAPALDAIAAATQDRDTSEAAAWDSWYYAYALAIVGRVDEAMTRTKDGYARLDATWSHAAELRQNWASLLIDRICALSNKKDYAGALRVYADFRARCRAQKVCADDVAIVYLNQSADAQNAGDWPSARAALQQCVGELPEDARCRDGLADLETRHRF